MFALICFTCIIHIIYIICIIYDSYALCSYADGRCRGSPTCRSGWGGHDTLAALQLEGLEDNPRVRQAGAAEHLVSLRHQEQHQEQQQMQEVGGGAGGLGGGVGVEFSVEVWMWVWV